MKKISLLFVGFLLVLFLGGCAAGAPIVPFVSDLPWGTPDLINERFEYSVSITGATTIADVSPELATGHFYQTLQGEGHRLDNQFRVTTELVINWNDHAQNAESRNLTDTITSTVVFSRTGLLPISSEKNVDLAPRFTSDNQFMPNHSYHFTADYVQNTSSIRFGKDRYGNWLAAARTIPIERGAVYDNEQLFFLLRAFNNMQQGTAINLLVNNVAENYVRNSHAPLSLNASVATQMVTRRVDALRPFTAYYSSAEPLYIDCLVVNLWLNETPSGPPHTFFITEPGREFYRRGSAIRTTLLVVGYQYNVYNIDRSLRYSINYTLTYYNSNF